MLFLFDGDCAFCTLAANRLRKMTRGRIPIEPYQFADLQKLGLEKAACEQAVQYLFDNRVLSGSEAISKVLIDSKSSWAMAGLIMRLPLITQAAKLVYRWVAKNRHRLPGSTPECQIPTDR